MRKAAVVQELCLQPAKVLKTNKFATISSFNFKTALILKLSTLRADFPDNTKEAFEKSDSHLQFVPTKIKNWCANSLRTSKGELNQNENGSLTPFGFSSRK